MIARQSGFKTKKSVSVNAVCGWRIMMYTLVGVYTVFYSVLYMLYTSAGGSVDLLSFTANHL